MIFFINLGPGEVKRIDIFLDERMLGDLRHSEPWAWQGLIEFIEDDLSDQAA